MPAPGDRPEGAPEAGVLLAVDLGLRIGWALYAADGRLLRYGSQHFGTRAQLKRAAYAMLSSHPGLRVVALEGGGDVALPWVREAERRSLRVLQVHAGAWRDALLIPRERRSGERAKLSADGIARRIVETSGAPRPTSLRHDAAEAILLGHWACTAVGIGRIGVDSEA